MIAAWGKAQDIQGGGAWASHEVTISVLLLRPIGHDSSLMHYGTALQDLRIPLLLLSLPSTPVSICLPTYLHGVCSVKQRMQQRHK